MQVDFVRYLAFKRMMCVIAEIIFLLALLIVVHTALPSPWFHVVLGYCALRILTEYQNHSFVAAALNVPDRWHWIVPFV